MAPPRNVYGMTFLQFATLVAVYDLGQRRNRVGVLAGDVENDKGIKYAGPKLKKLVALGCVERSGYFYRVTPKGIKLVERWRREAK
jgi:DNA-binding MarR family transcriptional regulator